MTESKGFTSASQDLCAVNARCRPCCGSRAHSRHRHRGDGDVRMLSGPYALQPLKVVYFDTEESS